MNIMKSLLLSTLLLFTALLSHAQLMIDFDSYQAAPLRGQGQWRQSYGHESFAEIVSGAASAENSGNALRLSSDSKEGVRVIVPLKGQSLQNRQVSYQVRMNQAGRETATAFASHLNFNQGKPKFVVAFGRSGGVVVFDGAVKASSDVRLVPGEWYQVDTVLAENGESVAFRLWRMSDRSLLFERDNLGFSEGVQAVVSEFHDFRFITTADSGEWDVRRVCVTPPQEL